VGQTIVGYRTGFLPDPVTARMVLANSRHGQSRAPVET